MLANTMRSRAVPNSASNNQNRIDILIRALWKLLLLELRILIK
ncbi:hypothetical protein A1E_01090 [Rickettsia canadensis str. McKiel]|uniref:Uncharacterized protein n=1 Tax=Rickettsia canadensis (strain McKiel) TaxID=293613 RepID=A8EXT0_RICCK|nr:hypothetical protein A1E_01090 [Rickettsia canadensis str. McKiel]